MLKNRKYLIGAVLWAVVALLFIIFIVGEPEWTPPTEDWWIRFESVEEIEEVRRLLGEGSESELLEFIEGTNNGQNIVNSRRDMEYFIEMIDDTILPVDTSWISFSYNRSLGRIFVDYAVQEDIDLVFIMRPRGGEETFDEIIERASTDNTFINITEAITLFSNQLDLDDNSLHIGNSVEAFSFYNEFGDYSIYEWEDSWIVTLSLNVDGVLVSVLIDHAPTLESAFEILANIEFSMGGGWFDNEQ